MPKEFYVTILDGADQTLIFNLADFNKDTITFGRGSMNDIVLKSSIVSKQHGCFYFDGANWIIYDNKSTNGLTWNSTRIPNKKLMGGDKLLIGFETMGNKVAFIFSQKNPQKAYNKFDLSGKKVTKIGRSSRCDISLDHVAVLRTHCRIVKESDGYYLEQVRSSATVQYNGMNMSSKQKLSDMDRFLIGDMQFIYQNDMLHYIQIIEGLSVDVSHLFKIVGKGKKEKSINKDVNLSINPSEFVAIIGGSGAGKSTLLKCLCGYSKISKGNVTIAGEDLASNYNSLKQLIGYVPQEDIVYADLTLEKMLYYTAKLRMPDDSTKEEIQRRIDSALSAVELEGKRDVLIKKLSGGQKKRASIAVELLSDPKLFFLDEPTSGLDPGTERNLMLTLKDMAQNGKTVVLVTHTPLNLHLCDKIIVMGTGGRLCFCGTPQEAQQFFGVHDLVDMYEKINTNAEHWASKYDAIVANSSNNIIQNAPVKKKKKRVKRKNSSWRQMRVLTSRYVSLQMNDLKRMLIQLLMAPGLGLILYAALNQTYPFKASFDTQKLALTLACCAFWVGLFNSIQEICKESSIYRRERMANLKLMPYVVSKVVVTAVLDLIQTILMVWVVGIFLGMPEQGMHFPYMPELEIFITTYLTMFSATCIGFVVSALVANSDQAISAAPILLIPQILFSGMIVELEGLIGKISYFISCRYACTAYCTTANINSLPSGFKTVLSGLEPKSVVFIHTRYSYTHKGDFYSEIESWFGEEFAQTFANPVTGSWFLLVVMSLAFIMMTVVVLKRKSRVK